MTTPPRCARADLLDFWRAVELFAPQRVPRLDAERCVYPVAEPLPWHPDHPVQGEPLGEKQAWQHVVYCGVYPVERAFAEIRAQYPSQRDVYDEGPPAGFSALAVFVLDEEGCPVAGSEVLASCAWASAQALLEGPTAVGTGAFERAAADFRARLRELLALEEGEEGGGADAPDAAPLDRASLRAALELVADLLDLRHLPETSALRGAREIRIKSRRVSRREARDPGGRELLNSFHAADLAAVANAVRHDDLGGGLREYLTSAQQVDAGRRIDVERDLAHVRRAVGVRRVPGGRWPAPAEECLALGQQFALNTIAGDRGEQRLFAVNGPPGTGKTVMLRDLLASNVVERALRLAKLERPSDAFAGIRTWRAARYERRVHCLRRELTGFEMVLACATNAAAENVTAEIPARAAIAEEWDEEADAVDYFAEIATAILTRGRDAAGDANREAWALTAAPLGNRANNQAFVSWFWFKGLLSVLDASREPELPWEQAVTDFREACAFAQRWPDTFGPYSDVLDELSDATRSGASERQRRLLVLAREKWHRGAPTLPFPDEQWEQPEERAERERRTPWVNEEWNAARTRVFLAALALHRALIEGAAREMRESLAATMDLLSAKAPADLSSKAALAAWQALFLVVPLVSTTFASFPYLFRHLRAEALGWLLIDEAGQATPQSAVGAIWRARRTVVLGDPLQLEPIEPLPFSIQTILRERHGVPEASLPVSASVQALADQVARVGTFRGRRGEEAVWVGAPLNVHRRCEEPMFAIVNEVAYQGQMINCTPPRAPCELPVSAWLDVSGESHRGNWIAAEGAALDGLLQELRACQADFAEVFVISPFRDVARELAAQSGRLRRQYGALRAGTIHTAQGREADVVIAVLGGNPQRPGARAWAAERPNLLNVAVSRARRRLYVIGDRSAWSRLPHFDVLAEALPHVEVRPTQRSASRG